MESFCNIIHKEFSLPLQDAFTFLCYQKYVGLSLCKRYFITCKVSCNPITSLIGPDGPLIVGETKGNSTVQCIILIWVFSLIDFHGMWPPFIILLMMAGWPCLSQFNQNIKRVFSFTLYVGSWSCPRHRMFSEIFLCPISVTPQFVGLRSKHQIGFRFKSHVCNITF